MHGAGGSGGVSWLGDRVRERERGRERGRGQERTALALARLAHEAERVPIEHVDVRLEARLPPVYGRKGKVESSASASRVKRLAAVAQGYVPTASRLTSSCEPSAGALAA